MARWLIEADCQLIKTLIQDGIAAALSSVSIARGDNQVGMEVPNEYFFYEKSKAMNPPSVYISGVSIDFRQSEKETNYISSKDKVYVTVVVQDQTGEDLVLKAWRYQAALHQVLDRAVLTSSDNGARLIVVVSRAEMSPIYDVSKDPNSTEAVFRREVYLECDVEHYENY